MKDIDFLNLTLTEAEKGLGDCSPNPAVGALIVRGETILASGFHRGPGTAHAEVDAIGQLSQEELAGATLYVSLEPCCHFGRTPPCTKKILESGISRVVYGYQDPNPIVSGKGHAELSEAGVKVTHHSTESIESFYSDYRYWMQNRKPFAIAKLAISFDGKYANDDGSRLFLTSTPALEWVHRERKKADAILTTFRTIHFDNPLLNVRLDGAETRKNLFVLDPRAEMSLDAKVCNTTSSVTLLVEPNLSVERKNELAGAGIRWIEMSSGAPFEWDNILTVIGDRGIHRLWIEAGAETFCHLIDKRAINRAHILLAPKWVPSARPALTPTIAERFFSSRRVSWSGLGIDGLFTVEFE